MRLAFESVDGVKKTALQRGWISANWSRTGRGKKGGRKGKFVLSAWLLSRNMDLPLPSDQDLHHHFSWFSGF